MLTLILSTILAAQPAVAASDTPPSVSVIVPVVGSVNGPGGVRWKTDVELVNDQREEAVVALTLPTAPDQPVIITTIPAGTRVRFTDVVGEAFGLEAALSPLLVQTLGRRSALIRATAYASRGIEIVAEEPIPINYGPSYFPQRTLPGLSFSDAYRTNVGLANLGDKDAVFVLALQRLSGRNLAVTRLPVPARTLLHTGISRLFPLITNGDDFSIVIETSSPETYVYASVIENATHAAKFIQPNIGAR